MFGCTPYNQPLLGCRLIVFTSAILLIGRRQGGEAAARAASTEGSPLLLAMSCSVLEVTSVNCSDMSSTLSVGGGETGGDFTGTGGGDCCFAGIGIEAGAGDGCFGVAPRFLGGGRGVAGVVETVGIGVFGTAGGGSSLLGGGGSIPCPD